MQKLVTIPYKTAQELLGLAVLAADSRKHNKAVAALRDAMRAAKVEPAAPAPSLFEEGNGGSDGNS